jgi:hypothetical protein
LRYRESDDGEGTDTPDLTDPARGRYDQDYRRSFTEATSPEPVVDDAPPPATEQVVQQMASKLFHMYMREREDPITSLGAKYVLVDRMSFREAAERITAEGHPITHEGLRWKLSRLQAKMDGLTPAEPDRKRLQASREGSGGRIPCYERNSFWTA